MKRMTEQVTIVVFGASGDLAKRKLIPALYHLVAQNLLAEDVMLLGFARSSYDDQAFREMLFEGLREHMSSEHNGGSVDETLWEKFAQNIFYQSGKYDERKSFEALKQRLTELNKEGHGGKNLLFYLATPPEVFEPITDLLAEVGLAKSSAGAQEESDQGWKRIIIEKPFGRDLESAVSLNSHLLQRFDEDQIYRIDHYLGKETVQNILVFRFGNGIFEPIWNRNYVDHVQITVAESLGIGSRGGYYDQSGALRDMVQNHLMQLVALTAMEPPVAFDAKAVRDQKVNVMHSIRRLDPEMVKKTVVRAQYSQGTADGKALPGYLEIEGIAANSTTPTYVAWKLEIDNWRWKGVPFYIRTGKALPTKVSEINIVFRKPPLLLFEKLYDQVHLPSNVLTLRIQPNESISLNFDAKKPGPVVDVDSVQMNFAYSSSFGQEPADAYERLLLDAMLGDSTLFIRRDEIEVAWDRITTILDGWEAMDHEAQSKKGKKDPFRIPQYPAGTWGPEEADQLMKNDGHYWRNTK
ncbi:MAG TPA: glucose-6-phosphate dehydrogenase [Caldilineaceae bacterium]|nr:glucose-6-phosphate dehydrogenase [Caldilineaceae bacterium]